LTAARTRPNSRSLRGAQGVWRPTTDLIALEKGHVSHCSDAQHSGHARPMLAALQPVSHDGADVNRRPIDHHAARRAAGQHRGARGRVHTARLGRRATGEPPDPRGQRGARLATQTAPGRRLSPHRGGSVPVRSRQPGEVALAAAASDRARHLRQRSRATLGISFGREAEA
jgi:hypothetical protein